MTTRDTGRELLWAPSQDRVRASRMSAYQRWLERERGLRFAGYEDLWRWSVGDLDGFWGSI
jgi:acetoacetyl-CoA synthetase